MPLGDNEDPITQRFKHVVQFPAQDMLGGTGSPFPRSLTPPFGGGFQQPNSFSTNNFFQGGNTNLFNNISGDNYVTYNNCNCDGSVGGGTITVSGFDGATTYGPFPGITTLSFTGSAFVSVAETPAGTAVINHNDSGGSGSTITYGKVTAAVRIGALAKWTYTVQPYSAGSPSGSAVTAYNLLERSNAAGLAYGITVTGTNNDQISGTNYYVRPVPVDAYVAMESTSDVSGSTEYWFSAPNPITGTC